MRNMEMKGWSMMKRYCLLMILLVGLLGGFLTKVYAYSPHFLPGGENYLSQDNFQTVGEYYVTINPFLVKPDCEYLLTIPRAYMENEDPETMVEFYLNQDYEDCLEFTPGDYTFHETYNVAYLTFVTPSQCNYLTLSFLEGSSFFLYEEGPEEDLKLTGIMLEEGSIFDGYETYVPGTIIDTDAPYFQSAGTIVSYVDDPISVQEIQSALKAVDAIDGDVSQNITLVSDDYTAYQNILGNYTVSFSVADASNNQNELTVNVTVVDVVKPVFSPIGIVKAVFPNTFTDQDLLGMMQASDNYDGSISQAIVIETNHYSASSQIVGQYEVLFSVTDSSDNQAAYTMTIQVVDEEAPVLSGIETILIGYDQLVTPDEVRSQLSVIDNYDSVFPPAIELVSDTYTTSHSTLGFYQMVFESCDSSDNRSTKTVFIQVVDQIAPVVYYDLAVIQVYQDRVLTLQEITTLLTYSKEIAPNENYQVHVDYDSYSPHAGTPGVYHLSLRFEDKEGKLFQKELEIQVAEKDETWIETPDITPQPASPGFFQTNSPMIFWAMGALLAGSNGLWWMILKKRK